MRIVILGAGQVGASIAQILVLFLFILALEESGYLPRAAFLLDRMMAAVSYTHLDVYKRQPLFNQPLREAREAFERLYFEHYLKSEGGNMARVADRTGLERTHLYRKLKQLGLNLGRRGEDTE